MENSQAIDLALASMATHVVRSSPGGELYLSVPQALRVMDACDLYNNTLLAIEAFTLEGQKVRPTEMIYYNTEETSAGKDPLNTQDARGFLNQLPAGSIVALTIEGSTLF